jgi:release factor glutamine methyltransferase
MKEKDVFEIGSVEANNADYFRYDYDDEHFKFKIKPTVALPNTYSFLLIQNAKVNSGETILDMGTGTGIIGIVLAKCYSLKKAFLTDINRTAIEISKVNATLNGVERVIEAHQGNLFSALEETNQTFDLILSDPAQTPTPKSIIEDELKIKKEFHYNTSGGEDGFSMIKPIIQQSPRFLKRGGRIQLVIVDYLGTDKIFDMMVNVGLDPEITAKIPTWLSPMTKIRQQYVQDSKKHIFPNINGKEYMHLLVVSGVLK